MSGKEPETIIIVRKKSAHGGHHGGAWKVAYADFVTAMMAFFLVMWLVTQSKEVKSAVGGYFREPGVFDFEKGRGVLPGGQPGVEPGSTPDVASTSPAVERAKLQATASSIQQEMSEGKGFDGLRDQVQFTVTSEGLRIDLVDKAASSFFDSGSAALRGESAQILSVIAHELGALSNDVVVEGHTDSRPYAAGERYGNWELSAERANAARRVLEREGLQEGQVRAVRGFADRQLQRPETPLDPRNRRVSIVVRSSAAKTLEDAMQQPARDLPSGPAAADVPSQPAPQASSGRGGHAAGE